MIKYPDKKERELTDKEKEVIKQKIRIGVPTQRIAEELNCAQTQVAALEAHLTMSGVGVRKFWKFSAGRGRPDNDVVIKNGMIVIWGWGIVDFDMKRFDKDGGASTFQNNIKKYFQSKDQKSQGEYAGYKQLTDFYFLSLGDIIFLYGKKPFTIAAICVVEKEYFYDPEYYKKIFREYYEKIDDSDARQSHFVGVKWLHKKPIFMQDADLKKKISKNATMIELSKEEALRIFKQTGIDPAEYLRTSNETIKPLEVEIKEIEEIENILAKTQIKDTEVLEGEGEYREVLWRYRNRRIINEKKSNSDYTCEICNFNFKEKYGNIGNMYIVVHHLNPIGLREEATPTSLEDLILVCDNCHRMLHKESPPYTTEELKKMIKENKI